MAKVSLRVYNREIEAMIDRGQLDEAIAHCQHIFKTFPKHLETYRLLGKAYLEYKRYNEAVDIFSRVLAAAPNDFVSNVGMSIIRDEQGKMDDAIWHMERAFETQPSNPAIQGELQRLYARRDGVQPPRIRMTRGALAHMYVQGELYPQAISEIKSVLKEDPGRSDMSVLLARAYFRSGQKNQAADEAAAVLRRYPYCLEANRVLVEIAGADRSESAQAYRQRVIELDPYAAHVTGTIFQTVEVGENAVVVEHLDWDGEPVAAVQPDWGTTKTISPEGGFGLGKPPAADQAEPDWLKMGLGDSNLEPQASTMPTPGATFVPPVTNSASPFDFGAQGEPAQPTPEEEIPEFLRAAGWGKSTGEIDESKTIFADEPATSASPEESIEQGDLPDWVKAMAPQQTAEPAVSAAPAAAEEEEELPDWIKNIGTGALGVAASQSTEDQADWLKEPEEPAPSTSVPLPTSSEEPDWMKGLAETTQPGSSDEQLDWSTGLEQPSSAPESAGSDETMIWLKGLEKPAVAQPSPTEEGSDWMKELGQPAETVQPSASDDSLDWLKGIDQPAESSQPSGSDETMAWLKGLDQSASAQPNSADEQPDWMQGIEQPAESSQPSESDDTMAWLKDLDQPESAQPTPVEEQPDWMRGIEQPAESSQPSGSDETMAWLKGLDEAESAQPTPAPVEEQPDWMKGFEGPADTGQTSAPDETMAWLKDLDQPESARPTPTPAPAPAEEQPDWIQSAVEPAAEGSGTTDEFDWLEGVGTEPEPASVTPAMEQPDWLTQFGSESLEPSVTELPAAPETEPPAAYTEPPTKPRIPAVDTGSLGKSEQEQDDSFAWLEALAAKQGASEGLLTKPEERLQDEPDWVKQAKGITQPSVPAEQPPAKKEEIGKSQEEIDDSLAWLESLAAKQGATEGLLTKPEDRLEQEPEWVKQARSASQPPVAQPAAAGAEELGKSQEEIDDSLAWLENLAAKQGATEGLLTRPEERRQDEPDWVKQAKAAAQPTPPEVTVPPQPAEPAPVADLGKSEQERDDSFAWLEALAAKQGASEGLLTKPEDRLDEEPEWVKQARSGSQEPASTPAAATASAEELGKSEQERDDSFAWLENLAAKQGATEGLLTKPEDRLEEEPEWVKQARSGSQEPASTPTAATASAEELGKSEQERDDSFAWLENLAAKQGATEGLLTRPEDRLEEEPEWVKQARSAPPGPAVSIPSAPTTDIEDLGERDQEQEGSFARLEDLAAEPGAAEGLLTEPEERTEPEPEWLQEAGSAEPESLVEGPAASMDATAAWLRGLEQEGIEPEPESDKDETVMWLKTLEETTEAEPAPQPEASDDLPSWLSDLEKEPPDVAPSAETTEMWLKSLDQPAPAPAEKSPAEADVPAWLEGIDEGAKAPAAEARGEFDWLNEIEEESVSTTEPAAGEKEEDLPSWLRGVDEETHLPATGALRSLPGWMRDETGEVMAEPTKIEPTRATDWRPAMEQETEQPSPEPVAPESPRSEPQPEPVTAQAPVEEPPISKPGTRKLKLPEPKPEAVPARAVGPVTPEAEPMLGSARNELSRSNIPGALQSYEKLIKKGRFLEDVIFDLREALYRYPVEVSIWQALGDAYMRANRLQDALDAYTKAEELLR